MRIVFFIGTLKTGGAERQIAQLSVGLTKKGHEVTVVALYPGGQIWEWLETRKEVELVPLFAQKPRAFFLRSCQIFFSPLKLKRLLAEKRASILYSVLYLSNFVAWLAVRKLPETKLVWGIRNSSMVLNWKRRLPFYFCKWVSSTVPLLISNSKAGLEDHQKEGFRARREVVIPNGIDTETFRPDLEAGAQLRARWSVKESEILIGLVGRLVEMKGHKIFLRAAARLTRTQAGVRFVCVGDGPAAYRRYLQSFGEKLGLGDKIIWAGELREMRAVYNAFDIFTLPSVYGEGFPNVVGEAMACGVPCVVTDVGDSAWLVGKTGVVVPPANPAALLDGWQILLREGPIDSSKLRSRIIDNFSLKTLVEETEKALLEELEHQ